MKKSYCGCGYSLPHRRTPKAARLLIGLRFVRGGLILAATGWRIYLRYMRCSLYDGTASIHDRLMSNQEPQAQTLDDAKVPTVLGHEHEALLCRGCRNQGIKDV